MSEAGERAGQDRAGPDPTTDERVVDVAVIGGGPAGATAALHLARARRRVLLLDANRPRHAATLHSHGYLTRDGLPPNELRALAREEVSAYPTAEVVFARVDALQALPDGGWRLDTSPVRGLSPRRVSARVVVLATGLTESLPPLPSIRAWYGTALHSCVACDGFEKAGERLAVIVAPEATTAFIRETVELAGDLAEDLTVLTLGASAGATRARSALADLPSGQARIRVEDGAAADLEAAAGELAGLRMRDGAFIPFRAGFVVPEYEAVLPEIRAADGGVLDVAGGAPGVASDVGRIGGREIAPGLFLAGDLALGPSQLLAAAADGAECALAVRRALRASH